MAPRRIKNLSLPERLQIEIEKVAKAQGRPVNDIVAEAVDCYVKDKQWESLKSYGREKAREAGLGEGDVERLVSESRSSMSR